MDLARRAIRLAVGKPRLDRLSELNLPPSIVDYLHFKDRATWSTSLTPLQDNGPLQDNNTLQDIFPLQDNSLPDNWSLQQSPPQDNDPLQDNNSLHQNSPLQPLHEIQELRNDAYVSCERLSDVNGEPFGNVSCKRTGDVSDDVSNVAGSSGTRTTIASLSASANNNADEEEEDYSDTDLPSNNEIWTECYLSVSNAFYKRQWWIYIGIKTILKLLFNFLPQC